MSALKHWSLYCLFFLHKTQYMIIIDAEELITAVLTPMSFSSWCFEIKTNQGIWYAAHEILSLCLISALEVSWDTFLHQNAFCYFGCGKQNNGKGHMFSIHLLLVLKFCLILLPCVVEIATSQLAQTCCIFKIACCWYLWYMIFVVLTVD